uniref:5' exonuclease Apollo n=1 Tax=Strigamia maritima TaxID=126957 RepID=T1JJI0_STRMM
MYVLDKSGVRLFGMGNINQIRSKELSILDKNHVDFEDEDIIPDDASQGLCNIRAIVFLVLWYLFSFSTLFLNKYILSYLHGDPTMLGTIQMSITAVCGFIQMYIPCGLYHPVKREGKPPRFVINMLVVGSMRFATVILGLLALKFVAVSFTETIKSSAPIFTVIISWLVLGERTVFLVNLSLVPVMGGLALCTVNEGSYNIQGFLAAMGTNLVECLQNVYSKMLISGEKYKYTPAELQFYTSLASIVVQIPVSYFLIDIAQIQKNADRKMLAALLINGLFFHLQSIVAYSLMGYISPVTHSVANTVKRASLIWLSVIIFGNRVTILSGVGSATVIIGVFLYNRARQYDDAKKRFNHYKHERSHHSRHTHRCRQMATERYSKIETFFLSHAHADHTYGLTSTWKSGLIYTSLVTSEIIIHKLKINPSTIKPLVIREPYLIPIDANSQEFVTVTLFPANHCEGAVLFLFQGYFGTILYTGDFRYYPSLVKDLRDLCVGDIDHLYLDNTYCNPKFVFKSRESALNEVLNIISCHLDDYEIVIGLRYLGKENILVEIAKHFRVLIAIEEAKLELFKVLGLPNYFTTDCEATKIRVVPFNQITKKRIQFWNTKRPTIAILPTCLFVGRGTSPFKEDRNIFVVPYSDHSSFSELNEFVKEIFPKKIHPIVRRTDINVGVFDDLLNPEPLKDVIIPQEVQTYMFMDNMDSKNTVVRKRLFNTSRISKVKGVVFQSTPEKIDDNEIDSDERNHTVVKLPVGLDESEESDGRDSNCVPASQDDNTNNIESDDDLTCAKIPPRETLIRETPKKDIDNRCAKRKLTPHASKQVIKRSRFSDSLESEMTSESPRKECFESTKVKSRRCLSFIPSSDNTDCSSYTSVDELPVKPENSLKDVVVVENNSRQSNGCKFKREAKNGLFMYGKRESALEESEDDIDLLELKLEKMVKTCSNMVEAGKAYVNSKSSFIGSVVDMSSYFKDDPKIASALNKLVLGLFEVIKYHTILIDQAQRSVCKNLNNFVKNDIRALKDTKRYFEKISDELDQSLIRNSQISKSKPHESDELNNVLVATRSCFQYTGLDYVNQMSLLQAKKRYEVLDTLLSYMQAQTTFFHQGADLCEDTDPLMKEIAADLAQMKIETTALDKQLEGRHNLVTSKVDLNTFRKTDILQMRWFIIQNNQLVYRKRSKDDNLTIMEEDLRLCSVKPANEIDRRFCFEILSPSKSHMLQADSQEMFDMWMSALQAGINAAIQRPTQEVDSCERNYDSKSNDSSNDEMQSKSSDAPKSSPKREPFMHQILAVAGNDKCCDCKSSQPRWASINLGITLCIECSGIHRSLGVHHSKVRSLNLDAWEGELVKIMLELGNDMVNKLYEANIDENVAIPATPECVRNVREAWIKAKYIQKAFVRKKPSPTHLRRQWNVRKLIQRRPSLPNDESVCLSGRNPIPRSPSLNPEMNRKRSGCVFPELSVSCVIEKDAVDTEEGEETLKSEDEDENKYKDALEESTEDAKKDDDEEDEFSDCEDDDDENPNVLLHKGARTPHLASICEALAFGADLNWVNIEDDGKTAIHQAICSGTVIACEYLFLNGAKNNIRDGLGRTPLHLATELGNTGQVCLLLKRGADQHALDNNGRNALSVAVENANADIVTLLRIARFNEEMKETEYGNTDDTFNEVVRDFSKLASDNPDRLKRVLALNEELAQTKTEN